MEGITPVGEGLDNVSLLRGRGTRIPCHWDGWLTSHSTQLPKPSGEWRTHKQENVSTTWERQITAGLVKANNDNVHVTSPGPHHHTEPVSNPGFRRGRRALYTSLHTALTGIHPLHSVSWSMSQKRPRSPKFHSEEVYLVIMMGWPYSDGQSC